MPLDADEFWVGTETSLRSALSEAAIDITALQADVVNFVQARHVLTADSTSLLTMTMRPERQIGPIESSEELVECGEIGFVEMKYPPKLVSRAFPGIVIHPGNHGTGGVPEAKIVPGQILCMHAPLRARSLFTGKLDQGRRVIEEDPGRQDYWHVRRWWRLARQGKMATEWATNSYLDGSITVGGHVKPLVEDTRLRDAARSFIAKDLTTRSDGDDALDPAVAAYLLVGISSRLALGARLSSDHRNRQAPAQAPGERKPVTGRRGLGQDFDPSRLPVHPLRTGHGL